MDIYCSPRVQTVVLQENTHSLGETLTGQADILATELVSIYTLPECFKQPNRKLAKLTSWAQERQRGGRKEGRGDKHEKIHLQGCEQLRAAGHGR